MKKILLFITVIAFLVSCEKQSGSDAAKQADLIQVDPAAGKNAEIVNNAVLNYFSTQKVNKDNSDKKDDKKDKKDKTKDFKISGSGAITYIPEDCGAGTLRFRSTGTAKANVLGTMDQNTTFCVDAATQQILTLPSGTALSKKGDQLFYSLAGMGVDPATGFTYQNYIFTGGTGEYEGATGSMTLTYHVFTPVNFEYTGTGSVTF